MDDGRGCFLAGLGLLFVLLVDIAVLFLLAWGLFALASWVFTD